MIRSDEPTEFWTRGLRKEKNVTQVKYMRPGLDFAVGKTVEELGELQAALGKTLRWGWDSCNPEIPRAERESNEQWVRREIDDVRGALDNLEHELNHRGDGKREGAG
jgi:hypothetical protein